MKKGLAFIFILFFLLTSCGNQGSSGIAQSGIKTDTRTEQKTEAITVHVHTWTPATCTVPKTCSVCGVTEGEPIAHTFEKGVCTVCGFEDPVHQQLVKGEIVYLSLATLKASCDKHIETIRKAWYYYIHSSEYTKYYTYMNGKTRTDNSIEFYANNVGFKEDFVREAVESYIKSIGKEVNDTNVSIYAGKTLESAIYIVQYAYKDIIGKSAELLQDTKTTLSGMSDEYETQTNYSILKQYFAEIKSYVDFCRSPNGSYNGLLQTKAQFQTNTNRFQNELSITYPIN